MKEVKPNMSGTIKRGSLVVSALAVMGSLQTASAVPRGGAPAHAEPAENRASAEVIQRATDDSAIERFQQLGVVDDDDFLVDDLARVPESAFPDRLSFDAATGEILFHGQRLIVERAPSFKHTEGGRARGIRRSRTEGVVYIEHEENFVGRLTFSDSWVDDAGNITLNGPMGSMSIFVNLWGDLVYLVAPPQEDLSAFYPRMFVASTVETPTGSDGFGTIASDHEQTQLTCKCDTAGCGTGCSDDDCDTIKTCPGKCGSCAWTTCNNCQ